MLLKSDAEWDDWVDSCISENHWDGRLTANRSSLNRNSLSQLIYRNSGELIGNTSDFIQWIKHSYGFERQFDNLDDLAKVNQELYLNQK